MSEKTGGYRGRTRDLLSESGVSIGDSVLLHTSDGEISGTLMPRYESANENYVVIKLRSGYNAGIEIGKVKKIARIQGAVAAPGSTVSERTPVGSLPRVALISTGGTIASKVDYRTGAVHPTLTASELYYSVPELGSLASIDAEVLFSEYSENLTPAHWSAIAKKVAEKVTAGNYKGVVISHGTDTMHYTASALSFALQNLPIPVVLVGAQRSSDRPSSDAAVNLIGAVVFAARSGVGGVFVAMHAGTSDDIVACHIGTRVRKNHTSRRDAFESIDCDPVALVKSGTLELTPAPRLAVSGGLSLRPNFDPRVALIKYYPGFMPEFIHDVVSRGAKAIVIEGTGLGHISRASIQDISNAVKSGVLVFMTSQCIWGRVGMTVYDTGRDLLQAGVIPLSNMLPETALTKAMWALANTSDNKQAAEIMGANLAGEIAERIPL